MGGWKSPLVAMAVVAGSGLFPLALHGGSLASASPALAAAATEAETLVEQGLGLVQRGQLEAAQGVFEQATALDPNLAAAHYNLGLVRRQQGNLQGAASAFWQAIRSDPNFAMAYANLGGVLLEGQNLPQAEEYLRRAIAIQPDLGNAHTTTWVWCYRPRVDCLKP